MSLFTPSGLQDSPCSHVYCIPMDLDSMIPLLILLVLLFPVLAIVAVVMALTTRERLRAIERRMAMIDRRIEGISGTATPPQTAPPRAAPQVMPTPDTIRRPVAPAAE